MSKYRVCMPVLPPSEIRRNPDTPIMDFRDMEYWLNHMDSQGWEFVSYGATHWKGNEPFSQDWWIFKKAKVN